MLLNRQTDPDIVNALDEDNMVLNTTSKQGIQYQSLI